MQQVFLVSEEYIKKNTLVSDNLDGKYLNPAITMAQDVDLDLILGPTLLDKLKDLVRTGDITLTGNAHYKKLLEEYVQPYLAWQVMSAVQISINYKMANSGVYENTDTNKQRLSYQDSKALQSQYERYANAYGTKLIDYLTFNANLYGEYKKGKNKEWAEDQQLCGIYLPTDTRRYDYRYK